MGANHKPSSRGTWRISIDSRGAMMDRVNSFRGCFLKDQGFVPPALLSSSLFSFADRRTEIRRRIWKINLAIIRGSSLRQFCDYCKLESQVIERSEGIGVLRRCDPRVRPRAQGAVSHRRGSVLARLHRVSPLSANSHDTPRVHVLGRYAAV